MMNIENRKAHHEYDVIETLECGIELLGMEVKSLRAGSASIKEAWVSIENGEMYIKQMHISKWETAMEFGLDTDRNRKLLAHKREIMSLVNQVKQQGYTLIPLKVYFNKANKCKVLVGSCKGRHDYDKREIAKKASAEREMQRAKKEYSKG